jgi:hypothetical protein
VLLTKIEKFPMQIYVTLVKKKKRIINIISYLVHFFIKDCWIQDLSISQTSYIINIDIFLLKHIVLGLNLLINIIFASIRPIS